MSEMSEINVVVVGGGPSGLMAAEVLSFAGLRVDVFDAMPSLGRKFLLAGIGGLNITHSEAYASFCARYADRQDPLQPMLDEFSPEGLRNWVHGLGVETFVGTSGRVFPKEMKAAPLLRSWLRRLRENGVRTHVRHKWLGWNEQGQMLFATPAGEVTINPGVCILALGGASWPQLGSDGAWVPWLKNKGVDVAPLESANCGFEVAWSDYLREKFAGAPLKSVALGLVDVKGNTLQRQGELVIGRHGVEGSLIYAFSREIRQLLNVHGTATFTLDLLPGRSAERVAVEVGKSQGGKSLPAHLKKHLGIEGVKLALLHEVLGKDQLTDTALLAKTLKALPITVTATRPIEEAISSAGGVCFNSLNKDLMISNLPGVFVAGEMLDWEAPTGGYLLTACFASGLAAGQGALRWLEQRALV
ncbi:MAG: TIGR03862 family flavoprotein [Burkholderiales bacterium]|nr:TIGR03862 family flavoprotein [Burkholderiales bacterium]